MGKSSGLAIVLAGAHLFCLGMLALLTLPCDSSVGAVNFGFSGFKENSLHLVLDSSWIFDITSGCFYFDPPESNFQYSVSGRFLYPGAVQMIDPGATTVKSFSTSFIYQLQILSDNSATGPGMAFIIVPDNFTIGFPLDFMGLITNKTSANLKNNASDDHTLGVELDTFMNPEFNDPNENHIGINLASMNSTYTIIPEYPYSLASSSADLYQQIWIDYSEADSRMDISYANYKQGKPAKPQGSKSGLNLSLLKENMYIGFSTAKGIESSNVPYVCAWSFSNDGIPAPPIVIAQDATPGAPPTPAPVPAAPPPYGPVAPPSLPPPASTPSPPPVPSRSPAPGISSPPPPASNPPPLRTPNPSPINPPNPPTPSSVSPQGPNGEPPTIAKKGGKAKNLWIPVGVPVLLIVSIGMIIGIIVSLCWCRFVGRPLRIFISHAGGPNGSEKNFPTWLDERMRAWPWSVAKSRVRIFFDRVDVEMGKSFAKKILRELARFDVGVVVVTKAFFVAKWPMTELIAFVEAQMNDPTDRIRVLPLFYELSLEQVKVHLDEKTWEGNWKEMSKGNHPLQVEKCRQAVTWLCQQRGIPYGYERRDQDQVYIEAICKKVDEILCRERSFASYLIGAVKTYCIPVRSKPGMTTHETEMTPL